MGTASHPRAPRSAGYVTDEATLRRFRGLLGNTPCVESRALPLSAAPPAKTKKDTDTPVRVPPPPRPRAGFLRLMRPRSYGASRQRNSVFGGEGGGGRGVPPASERVEGENDILAEYRKEGPEGGARGR